VPLVTYPVVAFTIFVPHSLVLDSLAAGEIQHWRPQFVGSKKHPQNTTQKGDGKEPPAEGSFQTAEEQVPTTTQTLHQQPLKNLHTIATDPTEQPGTQTEVLTLNTSAPNTIPLPHTNTKPSKPRRTYNKILRKKLKQSSRTCWHASARKMNFCASCRSIWPGETQWQKDLKSCSSILSRKEQLKQSCSEQ
jgi:hypothetical protein